MTTVTTYGYTKSIREDLSDIIYNISPTRTPFMSNVGRTTADQTYHEWQMDTLAAADGANAKVEGADANDTAFTAASRVGNYTQISDKVIAVSGTSGSVDTAGMKSLEAYLLAKRGRELKRDMEKILLANQAAVVGNSATARKLAGFPTWLQNSNNYIDAATVTPSVAPTRTSGNDGYPQTAWVSTGTKNAITETNLKNAIKGLWTEGGETKMLLCNPANKVLISAFTGIALNRVNIDSPKQTFIVGAADVYVSDFGNIDVVPDLFMPDYFTYLVDPEYCKIAYLRPFQRNPLAKTGDSRRTQMLVEYTLEVNSDRAHSVIVWTTA